MLIGLDAALGDGGLDVGFHTSLLEPVSAKMKNLSAGKCKGRKDL
jgi:hypothetical protein